MTVRASRSINEFVLQRILGSGGSGLVYATTFHGLSAALKVLRDDIELTTKQIDRFIAEADRMQRVSHPSLIALWDVGILESGRPFLVMPLVDGDSLYDRQKQRPFSTQEAMMYFEQLADALATLHDLGLIHRDVKPENIMITREGDRAILLDLGIARDIDQESSTTTQAGLIRGTPAYMAPERLFGARATPASDLYELTLVLFIMLTGMLPWKSDEPTSRLLPLRPSQCGVKLPPLFEETLLMGLAPDPSSRPQHLRSFALLLKQTASKVFGRDGADEFATVGRSLPPKRSSPEAFAPTQISTPSHQHLPSPGTQSTQSTVKTGRRNPLFIPLSIAIVLLSLSGGYALSNFRPSARDADKQTIESNANHPTITTSNALPSMASAIQSSVPSVVLSMTASVQSSVLAEASGQGAFVPKQAVTQQPSNTASTATKPIASEVTVKTESTTDSPVLAIASASSTSSTSRASSGQSWCTRLANLYCSKAFFDTNDHSSCLHVAPQMRKGDALPPGPAYDAYQDSCKQAYTTAVNVVLPERRKQIAQGTAPWQRRPAPSASP